MIGAARTWLTSVVAVSLLLAVVQTLVPEGTLRRTASFTGGLLLLVVLLRPLLALDELRLDLSGYREAVREREAELESSVDEALSSVIAERTEAYISDKAAALGLTVTARVEARTGADGVTVPWSAEVTGPWSSELSSYMAEELGIPPERQVYHGEES